VKNDDGEEDLMKQQLSMRSDASGHAAGSSRRGSEKKGYIALGNNGLEIDTSKSPVLGNTGYGKLGGGGYDEKGVGYGGLGAGGYRQESQLDMTPPKS